MGINGIMCSVNLGSFSRHLEMHVHMINYREASSWDHDYRRSEQLTVL